VSESDAAQALGDVSVVCLSSLGPVPFAVMLLGDLGARVTRVDRPGRTGSVTGLVAGFDIVDQIDCGTIGVWSAM